MNAVRLVDLLWPDGALEFAVCDVLSTVLWDVLIVDEEACIGGVFDSLAHALEQTSEFICRRFCPLLPYCLIDVGDKVPVLHHFARLDIHDRECRFKHCLWKMPPRQFL